MQLIKKTKMHKLFKNTKGASLVEYALLLALILVVAALVVKNLGTKVNGAVNNAGQKF